jgi:hypothetical protein
MLMPLKSAFDADSTERRAIGEFISRGDLGELLGLSALSKYGVFVLFIPVSLLCATTAKP